MTGASNDRSRRPGADGGAETAKDERRRRLEKALRENLRKRKEQARARRTADDDGSAGA